MTADAFIRTGKFSNVLLACGEVHTSGLDRSPAGIGVTERFGDGAAVVILGGGAEAGLEAVVCNADGRHYADYWIEYPKSSQKPLRITVEDVRAGKHYPKIDFDAVAEFGREHLADAVRRALSEAAVSVDDVDCFVLSHILPEVAEDVAAGLSLGSSKVRIAGVEHGHLSAASLPVALSEAVESGQVGPGARVCLATCGAGFTWGAALIRL
jgi:3-oxoacyl-[acyl-carrier-protein] synthase-3